jgi:peptidyl-prolyl cis-trans isomerase C
MTGKRPEMHSGRKVEGEIRGGTIDVNVVGPYARASNFTAKGCLSRRWPQFFGDFRMLQLLRLMPLGRAAAATIVVALLAGPALAQDDTVVATVNGQPVTEADIALAESELDQQFSQLAPDQRRAAAMSAIIEIRLAARRAEEAGLADTDEFERRMELLRQRALHAAFIEHEVAAQVTEEALRARYDREVAGLELSEEVRARHIIVETEEEAADIIAQLDAGGDFEELAREHSRDGAAQQGGDLGYFARGQMVPEFEQVVFDMEVDSYTDEPVETQFGWHVIQLVDRRERRDRRWGGHGGRRVRWLVDHGLLGGLDAFQGLTERALPPDRLVQVEPEFATRGREVEVRGSKLMRSTSNLERGVL